MVELEPAPGVSLKDFSTLTSDVTLTGPDALETIISRTLDFDAGNYLIRAIMAVCLTGTNGAYPKGWLCQSIIRVDDVTKAQATAQWDVQRGAAVFEVPLVATCKITLSAGSHTIALLAYLEPTYTQMVVGGYADRHVTLLEIWKLS